MHETEESIVARIRMQQHRVPSIRYADVDFPANDTSLYGTALNKPLFALASSTGDNGKSQQLDQKIVWLHPSEVLDNPVVFASDGSTTDFATGQMADSWLVSALATVASTRPDLLEELFETPDEDILDVGVLTSRFYCNGDWKSVTVDTRVPHLVSDEDRQPAFTHAANQNEVWPQLLMKCYAKYMQGYHHLHALPSSLQDHLKEAEEENSVLQTPALVSQALRELTAGIVDMIPIRNQLSADMTEELWDLVFSGHTKGYIIAARMSDTEQGSGPRGADINLTSVANALSPNAPISTRRRAGNPSSTVTSHRRRFTFTTNTSAMRERVAKRLADRQWGTDVDREFGLRQHMLYPITFTTVVGKAKHKFVKVRNPYSGSVWTGPWSRNSSKWADHPEIESTLWDLPDGQFDRKDSKFFWCKWQDFLHAFDELYVVRVWEPKEYVSAVDGTWQADSAAGPLPSQEGSMSYTAQDEVVQPPTGSRHQVSRHCVTADPDPSFFLNPQFRVTLPVPKMDAAHARIASRATVMSALRAAVSDAGSDILEDSPALRESLSGISESMPVSISVLQYSTNSTEQLNDSESNSPRSIDSDEYDAKDTLSRLSPLEGGFVVLQRPRGERGRVWSFRRSDIVLDTRQSKESYRIIRLSTDNSNMNVDYEFFATGIKMDIDHSYVVIPYLCESGSERPFTLRLASSNRFVKIKPIPYPAKCSVPGKWAVHKSSCGGALALNVDPRKVPSPYLRTVDNITPGVASNASSAFAALQMLVGDGSLKLNSDWGLNPQFHLTVRKPESDSFMSTQSTYGGTLNRSMTTTKNHGNTTNSLGTMRLSNTSPLRTRNGKNKELSKNPLAGLLNLFILVERTDRHLDRDERADGSKNYIGLYACRASKSTKKNDQTSVKPARRLEVGPREFCQCSDWHDTKFAVMHLRIPRKWLFKQYDSEEEEYAPGISIIPALRYPGTEGEFMLYVFSEAHLEVELSEMTADPRTITKSGEWKADQSAGGSHVHTEWLRNPAYVVRPLRAYPQIHLSISLKRPEAEWAHLCRTDGVGTMLGFYVVTCDVGKEARYHDGKNGILAQTKFVPLHEVEAELTIPLASPSLANKEILIIPATYDPKPGKFYLTVTSDRQVTFRPYTGAAIQRSV